ncbi:Gfo/Idh/MocA family protein [Paenibacillus allorhizosphaerae]|uniref:Inositol 2-dehydrogenase/D-chiro-inositol 3-dehydrogenase n=1 Tax=Paenibacillus allorhizosphaerae TaxID=2849866 RepID=A0ABN7TU21_9BACL|nr:Gfo/Idh/MocA family oxidoreductase [Paenibacillus allorhizosphaerae]CAG7655847.1 Inositol 2-dehydrogenase/D-chiro-inositol 3-dehydrogenase [Paenibacillus allorhizosphaerae]
MNRTKAKVALIGIGGFGKVHTKTIMQLAEEGLLECAAYAETNPEAHAESAAMWDAAGAAHYRDYEEMLRNHPDIDLVAIATPIPLHKPMSIHVMEQGFHVILEKPPAVTIQDHEEMAAVAQRTGRLCQVNFQNTSGQAFRSCLQKMQEGAIGTIKRVTGIGVWKRTQAYYDRTPWAGKLIHNGQYVLDGTLFNPFSHLLNNCLIAAGSGDARLAEPASVQAELYRANGIEGEDTASVRIRTVHGVEVLLYTTLCADQTVSPYIDIEGSEGSICWHSNNTMTIRTSEGEERFDYGPEPLMNKMYINLLEAIRDRAPLYSPLQACRSFVLAANGAFESSRAMHQVPEKYVTIEPSGETTGKVIGNVKQIIMSSARAGQLFSESEVEWAVRTEPFALNNYEAFRMFR